MKKCCGKEHETRFCPDCGTKLDDRIFRELYRESIWLYRDADNGMTAGCTPFLSLEGGELYLIFNEVLPNADGEPPVDGEDTPCVMVSLGVRRPGTVVLSVAQIPRDGDGFTQQTPWPTVVEYTVFPREKAGPVVPEPTRPSVVEPSAIRHFP